MLLRTMINCFLSAKENDFSFDQVDETQFFFYGSNRIEELFVSKIKSSYWKIKLITGFYKGYLSIYHHGQYWMFLKSLFYLEEY